VPESDPEDNPVTMSAERSMVIFPDASANRPVPPVMVWVSVIVTVGNTTMSPCPTTLTRIWSPFAAIQVAVPVAFPVALITVKSALRVNRPRCVAVPVPSRCLTSLASSPETICSVDCRLPVNGNAEPPLASVAAAPVTALDAEVGPVGTWPLHDTAKTHKPNTTYRTIATFRGAGTFGRRRGMFVLEHFPCTRGDSMPTSKPSDVRNCT
jgi:hypothetical protein